MRKKSITTRTAMLAVLVILLAGTASAALVRYAQNNMTATVDVAAASGLTVGVVQGLEADPTLTAGWQTSGTLGLTGLTAGGTSIITMMINNPTGAALSTNLNMNLTYLAAAGLADPNNCDASGGYDPSGTSACAICGSAGNELCIDAQEFEVIGFKEWNNAVGKWDPELDTPFSSQDCADRGITVNGTYNNGAYYAPDGTDCWWNIQDEIAAGTTPANPLVMASTSVNVPAGVVYYAVALRTKADPANNLQIAPGTYSLTVSTD
ncbi:MAG TPA: hypothetical protein VJI75_02000 [Candidatus Nanoarchaeia archaeon]|nr:hypothetical protein [Candidatus Nanoarchaeia archaeon]